MSEWDDQGCQCPGGNPPCSYCVDGPGNEDYGHEEGGVIGESLAAKAAASASLFPPLPSRDRCEAGRFPMRRIAGLPSSKIAQLAAITARDVTVAQMAEVRRANEEATGAALIRQAQRMLTSLPICNVTQRPVELRARYAATEVYLVYRCTYCYKQSRCESGRDDG